MNSEGHRPPPVEEHWMRELWSAGTTTRDELREMISQISEDRYCASWRHGVEFSLWDEVLDLEASGPPPWHPRQEHWEWQPATIRRLLDLAKMLDGWWTWRPGAHDPEFVSLDEWKRIYAHRQAEKQAPQRDGRQ